MVTRAGKPNDLLSIGEAAALLGLQVRTLRLYANQGRLPCERGPGARRAFRRPDVERLRDQRLGRRLGALVLYARVSSHRQAQEGDLKRQLARLESYAGQRVIAARYHDIASGLAEGRAGLRRALAACARPGVSELVVTHRERLARFGTGAIEQLLAQLGVRLTVIGEDADPGASVESELVRDMLAIVTSFSGRLYGARSAKARAARAALADSLR